MKSVEPDDLAVKELSQAFEPRRVINLKTARPAVPPTLLARVDEVIEQIIATVHVICRCASVSNWQI
jgi:hypothetical protein